MSEEKAHYPEPRGFQSLSEDNFYARWQDVHFGLMDGRYFSDAAFRSEAEAGLWFRAELLFLSSLTERMTRYIEMRFERKCPPADGEPVLKESLE